MFSTMGKKLINNWPEYKTIESDDIHSNLHVDNIMDTVAEFEVKKANLLKTSRKTNIAKSNFDTNLLIKIENMSEAEFQVFRKNEWNNKLQKEGRSFENIPSDFINDKNTCIKNLYRE